MFRAYHEASLLLSRSRDVFDVVYYDEDKARPLMDSLPEKRLIAKLGAMNRTEVGRVNGNDMLSPLFKGVDSDVLSSRFKHQLSSAPGKIADFETRFQADWGPPLSSSYSEYEDDRLIPHFDPYSASSDVAELYDYIDILTRDFPRYNQRLTINEAFSQRKPTSNLGPYHMCSWSRLSNEDRKKTIDFAVYTDGVFQSTLSHPVLIVPGTRISHAPHDAEPQDRNRVIMMVDIYSHVMLHSRLKPVMDMFKSVQPFSAIHRRENVRDYLLSTLGRKVLFGSFDSSRQDAAVKVGVPLDLYLYALSRILPRHIYDEVEALERGHHHPLYFSPTAIYTGNIGNPSGAFSTTLKNTILVCMLGCAVANRLRKQPVYTSLPATIFGNGDDLTLGIPAEDVNPLVDPVEVVESTYKKWGFTAKPSKQMISYDSILFCKTVFSKDPDIGVMTMAASNGVKKLIWRRPKASIDLAKSADFSLDDTSTAVLYVNIAKSLVEQRKFLKTQTPPSEFSMWPYYITEYLAFYLLEGTWIGPLGPLVLQDVDLCREYLVQRPDLGLEPTYGMGFLQSLTEFRYHPQLRYILETILSHIQIGHDELFSDIVIEGLRRGIPDLDLHTRFPLMSHRMYLIVCALMGWVPDRSIELLVFMTAKAVRFKSMKGRAPQESMQRLLVKLYGDNFQFGRRDDEINQHREKGIVQE